MNVFWFLPTHGDGHFLGSADGGRAITFAYLRQVAQAADDLRFGGVLLPTAVPVKTPGLPPPPWSLKRSACGFWSRRPGITPPAVAARMASTFDRLSAGRLLVNVVTGGDPRQLAGDGLFLAHDERYRMTDEFLTIWRRLTTGDRVDFQGQYLHLAEAELLLPPVQKPYPPLYFGGTSEPALVGDPEIVATRMQEYADMSIDTFILSGYPHLAEAYRVAELLFPRLQLTMAHVA